MCSEDRSATSISLVALADTADKRRYWENMTAAYFAHLQFASPAGRQFAAGASAGLFADADACFERAAVQTADSGDGSDSDEATAEDSGNLDSSSASHCLLDAVVRINRAVFALACLAPKPTNRLVNNKLPLNRERLSAFCRTINIVEIYYN